MCNGAIGSKQTKSIQNQSLFILLLLLCLNCTQSLVRDTSGQATRSAIQTALADDLRRKILQTVLKDLQDPEVRTLARQATREFMAGAIQGIGENLEGKIDPLVSTLTQAMMRAIKEQGGPALQEALPSIEDALRKAVASSVRAVGRTIRQSAKGDLNIATQMLVRTAVQTALESLGQAWKTHKQTWAIELEHVLLEQANPILEKMVRHLAKEAIYGLKEGIHETKFEGLPSYDAALHEAGLGLGVGIGEGLAKSVAKDPMKPVLLIVATVLGAISITNLILVFIFWRKYERASKSLSLFVHQLSRISGTDSKIPDLMSLVEAAHKAAGHGAWLDQFLKRKGLYPPSGDPIQKQSNEESKE